MNRLDAIIDKYFEEGLLTLTGARDKYGYHIITLPAHHLVSMETMDARYFVAVLHRYILWEHLVFQNNPGIAVLLNLKNTRKSVIQIVADALTILESKKKTIIQMVYIVKPDTRVKSHLLKKLLGIKPPQRLDNPRQFQIQMVKTLELLRNYIEPGQLTRDYGGMLYHDHQAWLKFYKKTEPCLNSAKKLMVQLPGIKEKVELWEEYASSDHSVDQLHQVLDDIPQQFETLLKECNFESVLEDCKQLLHVLETTDNDINNALISPVIVTIRKYYQDLTQFHQDLVLLYKTAETKISATFHLLKCHEKANKIVKIIKEEYESQLLEHPAVGLSLSQAELYRNHFTSSIYQPCKNLISEATDILEELKKVVTKSELRTSITSQLTATIEPFTLKLHTVHESYIQLHIFHTLLTKFGKWYKKVLKFLPEYLRKQTENESQDKIINMPDEWNYTVDTFLSKHPPPREEHIVKIDHDMPSLLPKQLKQQAHCLAIRTKLLQRLLTSRRLPVKLIKAAMTWKDELQPPVIPLKLKPQIKISSPSSASSNEEEEKQRFKLRSPRRKSVQNVSENMKHDLSIEKESKVKPDLKIESPKPVEGSKERFIRLTFTPKDFEEEVNARQRFSFSDVVKDTTGSESGIEVVDPEDPYDTIIDKICEVSNSPISSDLKLKYVTNLLRCSLRDAELQKPRYQKNTRRARRHSKLKSAYGKSVGNLLDMERPKIHEPKMSSFHSLRNLSEIGVDNEVHPSGSELFLSSLRPTSSLHDLYSEVERSPGVVGLPEATGMSKWYHGYERKANQKPLEEDCYSERLQNDIRRLQRCHSDRMEEESILEKDKQRLDEIVMEAELYKQDRVENSLRRSHDILQNEEMRLNEDMSNSPTWIRNYEDLASGHAADYRHPKSDLGYDSVSSPRTFSRMTGSSRPILSSKTSYEDPDYHYETKHKGLRNSGHALSTPTQQTSKASQALGSILPRFNSTDEIDEFCVQLKSKSLYNKTVAEVHQSDLCHNQPSTSQYREDDNFLDDTDFY
ncbi:hypothetical protein LOTGIDRAFT_152610 [Lottia gigantea]|uniref:CRAL-TRIO domain-containing protein n=1 Tax=Lottia gigantea TaxID=225164 RepID=V4C759_LOTGI|nr:hypothetical protein LOTGIDRAFT_152610 [Lottia gigantea]ESO97519.1 hypothetical protein LOTGIDRAFT_152610 [Lottia gigantea]